MSASLVGSEMCIRDSSEGAPRGFPGCSRGNSEGVPNTAVGQVVAVRGEASVSYTHLTLPTICSV
eukprot:10496813-Alexandrium_andersonii.AAC.1